jgi:hypothetical protein
MTSKFDINKVIFQITSQKITLTKTGIIMYLDYNPELPVGKVWFFQKGDKLYGRIKWFMHLKAFSMTHGRLGMLFPSVEIEEIEGKLKITHAYVSNWQRDIKIEAVGKQILRRKITALGLQCYRESKLIIWGANSQSPNQFISMVYSGDVTPRYTIIAELLLETQSHTPISILYENPNDHTKDLFYLNEI